MLLKVEKIHSRRKVPPVPEVGNRKDREARHNNNSNISSSRSKAPSKASVTNRLPPSQAQEDRNNLNLRVSISKHSVVRVASR